MLTAKALIKILSFSAMGISSLGSTYLLTHHFIDKYKNSQHSHIDGSLKIVDVVPRFSREDLELALRAVLLELIKSRRDVKNYQQNYDRSE